MKCNVKSFSKLFMTATAWGIPPDAVIFRENHTDPPSLVIAGAMRLNSKEDFHPCQESVTEKAKISEFPDDVSANIDDGASMVHFIVPDTEGNYKEYSEKFIQHGEIKWMK